jgi:hypothetical protein
MKNDGSLFSKAQRQYGTGTKALEVTQTENRNKR